MFSFVKGKDIFHIVQAPVQNEMRVNLSDDLDG